MVYSIQVICVVGRTLEHVLNSLIIELCVYFYSTSVFENIHFHILVSISI